MEKRPGKWEKRARTWWALGVCLVLILGQAGLAMARNYYVARNGRNTNPGTITRPWATLQHAVERVRPGDTILVKSGTYAGCRIEKSGKKNKWITLKAAPGANVVINRPSAKAKHQSNIELETWDRPYTVSYWVIEGFEVARAPRYGIEMRGTSRAFCSHITVRRNVVHHSGVSGIFTAFTNWPTIEGNRTYSNGEHGVYHSNSGDYPTIRDNESYSNRNCGLHFNGDESMGGDGLIKGAQILRNVIHHNGNPGGAAINLDGVTNSAIIDNLLYDNNAGGIAVFVHNGAKGSRYNRILRNHIYMPVGSRWAVNLAQTSCINNKVLGNTIYTRSYSYRGSITIPTSRLRGFKSDYNKVTDRFSVDDGDSVIKLARWRSYGYGRNTTLIKGNPKPVFVRGYVRVGGRGLRDVKVSFSNGGGYVYTNKRGYFSKALPYWWSGRVTPNRQGYSFSPSSKSYRSLTRNRSLNFTATRR